MCVPSARPARSSACATTPRLLVAPCTVRGKPLGAPLEATARMLPPDDEPLAERVLAARYGFGRVIFEWAMDVLRVDMGYLEITPGW